MSNSLLFSFVQVCRRLCRCQLGILTGKMADGGFVGVDLCQALVQLSVKTERKYQSKQGNTQYRREPCHRVVDARCNARTMGAD